MAAHRHNRTDATAFYGTRHRENTQIAIPFIVTRPANAVHQLTATHMTGVLMTVDVAFHGCVHGDNSKPSDHFGRVTDLTRAYNYVARKEVHVGINIQESLVCHCQRGTTRINNLALFHVIDDCILHNFRVN